MTGTGARHFLSVTDYTPDELKDLLSLAQRLKQQPQQQLNLSGTGGYRSGFGQQQPYGGKGGAMGGYQPPQPSYGSGKGGQQQQPSYGGSSGKGGQSGGYSRPQPRGGYGGGKGG